MTDALIKAAGDGDIKARWLTRRGTCVFAVCYVYASATPLRVITHKCWCCTIEMFSVLCI